MSETTSTPSLSRRTLRSLSRAGLWLSGQLTSPVVLVPLMVLLATGLGFQQNAALYRRAALAAHLYDATLIVVLLLPPLIGHLTAWACGHRSGFWWLLWLPAVALYWLRPWHTGTEWAFFWREHPSAREHLETILRQQAQAPLRSFIRLGGLLTMAMVTFMVLARSWLRLAAWMREVGRDTGDGTAVGKTGAGKAEGLPQATWASAGEVRRQFTHKGGIVLGEHTDPLDKTPGFDPDQPRSWNGQGKGRLITMDPARGNGHVIVLAASAGYKTAGIVIPNILHYNNPLVVIDPKGDLHARTRAARKAMGFEARVIDARHGFDPFKLIAPLAPEAPSVYLTMARTLMPLGERASDISEYFHDMSTTLFAALMGHFISENSDNVARDISTFINRERKAVIADAQNIAMEHNFPFISDEMEGLAALDERTFPGVVKGISNKLAFARFPDIAAYGQSSDSPEAHLAALDPKSDIFINFPAQAAEDFSSFPRLLIGAIYVTCELIEQPDRPRARRLFLVDEARVLGGTSALHTIRDAGRSLGLHLMLIYQNYGQLTKAWGGEAGAAAWLDSCEARVISAVGSSRTANDIVTMLGRCTLRTRVQGASASSPVMAPMGGSVSSSEQEQIREVSLMSAAALGQLPAHGALIFTRRTKPILATKAVYFTRENMAARVRSPDAVTDELEATRRREAVEDRIREQALNDLPDPQPGLRRRRKMAEPDAAAEAPDAPEDSDTSQRTKATGRGMEGRGMEAERDPVIRPGGAPGGHPDPEPGVEQASPARTMPAPVAVDHGAAGADTVNASGTGEAQDDAAVPDPNPEWGGVEAVIRNMDATADAEPDEEDAPDTDSGPESEAQTSKTSGTGRVDTAEEVESAPSGGDTPNALETRSPNAPDTDRLNAAKAEGSNAPETDRYDAPGTGGRATVPDFRARNRRRLAAALADKARRKQAGSSTAIANVTGDPAQDGATVGNTAAADKNGAAAHRPETATNTDDAQEDAVPIASEPEQPGGPNGATDRNAGTEPSPELAMEMQQATPKAQENVEAEIQPKNAPAPDSDRNADEDQWQTAARTGGPAPDKTTPGPDDTVDASARVNTGLEQDAPHAGAPDLEADPDMEPQNAALKGEVDDDAADAFRNDVATGPNDRQPGAADPVFGGMRANDTGYTLDDEDRFTLEEIMGHLAERPALRTAIADVLRDEPDQAVGADPVSDDSAARDVHEPAPTGDQRPEVTQESAAPEQTDTDPDPAPLQPAPDDGAAEEEPTAVLDPATSETAPAAATDDPDPVTSLSEPETATGAEQDHAAPSAPRKDAQNGAQDGAPEPDAGRGPDEPVAEDDPSESLTQKSPRP